MSRNVGPVLRGMPNKTKMSRTVLTRDYGDGQVVRALIDANADVGPGKVSRSTFLKQLFNISEHADGERRGAVVDPKAT